MRSSIACIRCRRSKVKCVNNGVGTTCRSCENSGRECTYPSPVPSGGRRRDSVPAKPDAPLDSERRQRPRKSIHTTGTTHATLSSLESSRPVLDALDPQILTPTVWQELFDIFQLHYSADLPFLHPPTFLKPLRQASMQPPPTSNGSLTEKSAISARPPASSEFLLAFLALTARFHPKLVAHHSPPTATRPSNPMIASEYYAAAALEKITTSNNYGSLNNIERLQSLLMMGLHDWGMCRGARAWLSVGMSIRTAQAMGLQYERDLDDEPLSRSQALAWEAERLGVNAGRRSASLSTESEEEAFVQQEIRRRTFWSCYIMDRYLSSGKYRPQMLRAREMRIQLPASERSFLFAEKVRTLMLDEEEHGRAEVRSQRQASVKLQVDPAHEPSMTTSPGTLHIKEGDEDRGRLETGVEEGLVSRYVKILEIYGKVVQWSCAGGRRGEIHPPWDPRCEWYKLHKLCLDFRASLPRQHTLTPQNTQAHISLKTSTPYILVHTVYLLSQIILHREYVPFIPLRCSKPEGPLDPPIFSPERFDVPPSFWEDSARECFKAAREMMELAQSCQEWNALVETPIVGFAIYTAAFVGCYCINFPWMDPEGYMCTPVSRDSGATKPGESKGFHAAKKSLEIIGQMSSRLHMADGWFKTINRMHRYLKRMKSDYQRNVQAMDIMDSGNSPESTRHLSLREGGIGGGLNEYRLLERTLNQFGNLDDEDFDMTDAQRPRSRSLGDAYEDSSAADTTVKSEDAEQRAASGDHARSEDRGPWNAINAGLGGHGEAQAPPKVPTPSAPFRSYDSYASHPQASPQQHPSQQQPYASVVQINSFRPAYSRETPSAHGGAPSLTSPASHSVSTSTQSQSNPSPPFERRPSQPYNGWTPHASSYAVQLPQQQQQPQIGYSNGMMQHSQLPSTPIQHSSAYPSPICAVPQQHQPILQQPVQPAWDTMQKEEWLNSLQTQLSADDLAAFANGGEVQEYANRNGAYGWLSTIWHGAATG